MAAGLRRLTEREAEIVGKYAARHGQVLGLDMPISDDRGDVSSPLIRLSTLSRLERRGVISSAECAAGAEFHRIFQLASLDALRAPDMGRTPAAAGYRAVETSDTGERARRRVSTAVTVLGGAGSIAASAIWHVAGLEWPVSRWAVTARRPREQCCGILIGALAALAAHFASGRPARRA